MELRNLIHKFLNFSELEKQQGIVNISFNDLNYFPELKDLVRQSPDEFFKILKDLLIGVNDIILTDVEPKILIKDIGVQNNNNLISFYAVISKRSEIQPYVMGKIYKCDNCGNTITLKPNEIPGRCSCKKGKYRLQDQILENIQVLELQELLEKTDPGVPAPKIKAICKNSLINKFLPGDIVEVNGILRLTDSTKSKDILSKYVDIVGIKRLKKDFDMFELSEKEIQEIIEFSKNNPLYKLASIVFPDIYGYDLIKQAVILQMVSGSKRYTKHGTRIRDNIHILLIGDPGIAKSRILQQVSKISPKAIYVSGKSVSGVGLTASVEKEENFGWTLKAGAVVLASGGLVAIDEFDKIDEDEKAALHEVMESGSVSIAKAGIVVSLVANTNILAAANPKRGRFDSSRSIIEQFNIQPSLLSRFDLIFPLIDIIDESKDQELAQHILNFRSDFSNTNLDNFEFVRKYISYARKFNPIMTEDAKKMIIDFYVNTRKSGKESKNVTITPRYIESISRLAEASAKIRLSKNVELIDVQLAIDLMNEMLANIMRDPETGQISVDMLYTGMTASKRSKLDLVSSIIDTLIREEGKAYKKKIISMGISKGLTEEEIKKYLEELKKSGEIYEARSGEEGYYSKV